MEINYEHTTCVCGYDFQEELESFFETDADNNKLATSLTKICPDCDNEIRFELDPSEPYQENYKVKRQISN